MGYDFNANEPEPQNITLEMLLEDIQDLYGFEAIDKDDMGQWLLYVYSNQPRYEVKDDATIAAEPSSSVVLPVEEHSDDPTDNEEEVPVKKVSHMR
jgi:hypothetical protein